jgi:hypothetical protein
VLDLEEAYGRVPTTQHCTDCHKCATRCAGEIPFLPDEWDAVRVFVREHLAEDRLACVLAEEKTFPWDDEGIAASSFCPLYDRTEALCLVYPVRPLVCRLLGFVEWMPCPIERPLPLIPDGRELLVAYAAEGPRPIGEWLRTLPLTGRPAAELADDDGGPPWERSV